MDGDGGVTWFRIKVNGKLVYEEAWLNMTRTEFSLWDALPAEYRERGVNVTDVRYMAGDGMTVEMREGQRTEGDERCSTTSRSSSKRTRWTSGSTGCSTTWAIITPT